MQSAADTPPNWEDSATYQRLIDSDTDSIREQLVHPTSEQAIQAFVKAMSDRDWMATNPTLGLCAISLMPPGLAHQRHTILQALATSPVFPTVRLELFMLFSEACTSGDWAFAKEIAPYLDRSITMSDGSTPLHLVCACPSESPERIEIASQLLFLGIDPNVQNANGDTALHLAAAWGDPALVTKLLEHHASLELKNDKEQTALMLAAGTPLLEVARILISHGADVKARDKLKATALHYASEAGSSEVIGALLEAGADIEARDVDQQTALHVCAFYRQPKAVEALLWRGAAVDAIDINQRSALHLAVFGTGSELHDTLVKLLEHNPDLSLISHDDVTPFVGFLCSTQDHEDRILALLSQADNERGKGVSEELMERKLLSLNFGIGGNTELQGKTIDTEGFGYALSAHTVLESISKFYHKIYNDLQTPDRPLWMSILSKISIANRQEAEKLTNDQIIQILNLTKEAFEDDFPTHISELYGKIVSGDPIAILTGWRGHAIGLAIVNGILAVSNRGAYSSMRPGVKMFRMGRPDMLLKVLDACLPGKALSKDVTYLVSQLEKLDQIPIGYLPQKAQKIGNCTIANANGMELGVLYLQLLPIIGDTPARALASAIKGTRTQEVRLSILTTYLDRHRTPQPQPPDINLLRKLYHKTTGTPETDLLVQAAIKIWARETGLPEAADLAE